MGETAGTSSQRGEERFFLDAPLLKPVYHPEKDINKSIPHRHIQQWGSTSLTSQKRDEERWRTGVGEMGAEREFIDFTIG